MGAIKKWVIEVLFGKYATSLYRRILAVLGTWLVVTVGLPEDVITEWTATTLDVLVAATPIILSQIWSWIDKKTRSD